MKKILLFLTVCIFISCKESKPDSSIVPIDKANYDTIIDNKKVELYTLRTPSGMLAEVTNFGGRIVSIWVPDRQGNYADVVLGFDRISDHLNKGERYLGPVVGRYANRIAKGKFKLDENEYQLPINDNQNCLHGGNKGFDLIVWNVDSVFNNRICLSYLSPDGEEGFPGNLKIGMTYTLTDNNELKIEYTATTDKATIINLSNHSVFNLKGYGNGTIEDHELMIKAEYMTPVDPELIPTGELVPVVNTPFDFNTPKAIGRQINDDNQQLTYGKGYDHNWVLTRKTNDTIEQIATLYEPISGRMMEIWTDQPGLQFYSGNFLNGKLTGKENKAMKYREGLALETQKYPDSPNHPDFPSTRLDPGETYIQNCIYKFLTK